jgi:hypothetical protein
MLLYTYEEENYGMQQAFRHEGMGGQLTYTYNRCYAAAVSFGLQATETFSKDKRTGFFPAGSLSWLLTQEAFLKDNATVNYLKIKASYGLTGNDKIGGASRFMYDQEYGYREGYPLGTGNNNIGGIAQLRLANPDITWEKETKLDIGVETKLMKVLDFSFDYFSSRRNDILCLPNRTIPSYLGAELPYMNKGKTKNQGFETIIRYNNKINNDFSYYAQLSAWMAKNEITYQSEGLQAENNTHLYSTGHRIFQPFYLKALGFYTQAGIDDPDIAKPEWKNVLPGDLRYEDINKDGIIDSNDQIPFGYTSVPEISMGLDWGFTYKGIDFSLSFQAALNRDVYLNTAYYSAFQNNGNVSEYALNR